MLVRLIYEAIQLLTQQKKQKSTIIKKQLQQLLQPQQQITNYKVVEVQLSVQKLASKQQKMEQQLLELPIQQDTTHTIKTLP